MIGARADAMSGILAAANASDSRTNTVLIGARPLSEPALYLGSLPFQKAHPFCKHGSWPALLACAIG